MRNPERRKNNTVRLISSDRKVFDLDENVAMLSETIKTFISPKHQFLQYKTKIIELPIKGKILKRCIEFMNYKLNNSIGFIVSEDETTELLDVASYLRL